MTCLLISKLNFINMHKDMNVDPFKDLEEELNKFQNRVTKELDEVRQCKEEIQHLKSSLIREYGEFIQSSSGNVLRDEHRIVLSAPEIIIGNVDNNGVLFNAPSRVVIRANGVALEGAGFGGNVTMRASSIRSIA